MGFTVGKYCSHGGLLVYRDCCSLSAFYTVGVQHNLNIISKRHYTKVRRPMGYKIQRIGADTPEPTLYRAAQLIVAPAPSDEVYAFLALPTHTIFHEALHRSLLRCWAPQLPDGLQREDASFFEQLYGECRPYLDVDKELPSGDAKVLLDMRKPLADLYKAAAEIDLSGVLGKRKTLCSSRPKDDHLFKFSEHALFPL
eukprot:COSAG02_NODE_476_length_21528_cov_95.026459_8_plen_198_part_00